MGIEKVKDEVIGKARKEADRLEAEALTESKHIKNERNKQFDTIRKDAEGRLEKQKAGVVAKATSSAQLEAKKEMLNARKNLIEDVFAKVRGKLQKLPQSSRKAHIATLLAQAKNEIEVSKVYCAAADLNNISDCPAAEVDIIGGIIAENADGSIKVDLSYDSLLEEVYRDSLKEVSETLFKK